MSELTRRSVLQLLGVGVGAAAAHAAIEAPDRRVETTTTTAPAVVRYRATQLEAFLKARGIKPTLLAREAGYARDHLFAVRMGRLLPTLPCIAALTIAARRFVHDDITPGDLFERDVIATAIKRCDPAALQRHHREQIIAAFGRRAARRVLRA